MVIAPCYGDGVCVAASSNRVTRALISAAIINRHCTLTDSIDGLIYQRIYHAVKHVKQAVENLCPGNFRFLLVRQGFVGVIGRLHFFINRLLFLQTHSGQLVRRGEGVDQLLHVPCGKLRRIRGGGRFRLVLCVAYLADIAAGRPLSGRGIAAVGVVFCVVFA